MKEKTKEFLKKYLIGFILGVLSAGIVVVYAETYFPSNQTTYDNSTSGLQSENVQDAIDELYGVCFPSASDQLIEDAELEKDPYECRYFFTGANPNNYITFNNETASWRIISVECDGTIKIMRNDSIGDHYWDEQSRLENLWDRPATLNTYLNGEYYNSLNSNAQEQIVSHNFGIGAITRDNNDLAGQVNDENSKTWNGKIALPTASEYIRTNSNTSCKTINSINSNYSNCRNTTWMYINNFWWTLSKINNYVGVSHISDNGSFNFAIIDTTPYMSSHAVRPTLYLSSNIRITGGNGTQSNPYTIE